MHNKLVEGVAEKLHQKYSSITTVIMIIQVIISLIRLYQACKQKDNPKRLGVLAKRRISKEVKKNFPSMNKQQVNDFTEDLVNEIVNSKDEEINVVCSANYN